MMTPEGKVKKRVKAILDEQQVYHFSPMQNGMDADFDTGNSRYKARERYSFGVSDPLGVFGSPGA